MTLMLENRMAVGEYYDDECPSRERLLDSSEDETYDEYVCVSGLYAAVFADHYDMVISESAAEDLAEDMQDSRRVPMCVAWVRKHDLEGFINWREDCWR